MVYDFLSFPSLNVLFTVKVENGMIPADLKGRKIEVERLIIDDHNKKFYVEIKGGKELELDTNGGFMPTSSGSSYNVAYGLKRLGKSTCLLGVMNEADMFGGQLARSLKIDNVELVSVPRGMTGTPVTLSCIEHNINGAVTTTLFVYKPPYQMDVQEATRRLGKSEFRFMVATGVRSSEVGLTKDLFAQKPISNLLVPNSSICENADDVMYRSLFQLTHILQVNYEEAEMITGHVNGDLQKMATLIANRGPKRVIITKDKDGVFIGKVDSKGNMKFYEHPAFVVEVADTEGAGDAFTVGFLYALEVLGYSIKKSLMVGCWVASQNIQVVGGYGGMPSLAQLSTILKS